jgi:hypothetical protein
VYPEGIHIRAANANGSQQQEAAITKYSTPSMVLDFELRRSWVRDGRVPFSTAKDSDDTKALRAAYKAAIDNPTPRRFGRK